MMNKAKRLLKLIENLLNPDDEYNSQHLTTAINTMTKKPIYKNDQKFVSATHNTLSDEANKHLDPDDSFSPVAKAAVRYSGLDHHSMNSMLRHGVPNSEYNDIPKEQYQKQIDDFKTLTKNPTQHSFNVYRGVGENAPDIVGAQPGEIIHDKGFTSTSLRPMTATSFTDPSKGRLFKIHITPGTKGHYLSAHNDIGGNNNPTEAEFVLHPGTKLEVGDTHTDLRGQTYTHLHIHSQED